PSEFTRGRPVGGAASLAAPKSVYATAVTPPLTLEAGGTKSGVKLALQRGFPLQVQGGDPDRAPGAHAIVDIMAAGDRETFRMVPLPCSVLDRSKCRTTGAGG